MAPTIHNSNTLRIRSGVWALMLTSAAFHLGCDSAPPSQPENTATTNAPDANNIVVNTNTGATTSTSALPSNDILRPQASVQPSSTDRQTGEGSAPVASAGAGQSKNLAQDDFVSKTRRIWLAIYERGFPHTFSHWRHRQAKQYIEDELVANRTGFTNSNGGEVSQYEMLSEYIKLLPDTDAGRAEKEALSLTPAFNDLIGHSEQQRRWPFYRMSRSVAEDVLLKIYRLQAKSDIEDGNYHRANLIYRMIRTELDVFNPSSYVGTFVSFFQSVPDPNSVKSVGNSLMAYAQQSLWSSILQGEHAAVLYSANRITGADYMLHEIETRMSLITLPIMEQIVAYGEAYAFQPSENVVRLIKVFTQTLQAVEQARPASWDDGFLKLATGHERDDTYANTIRALITHRDGGPTDQSLNTLVETLSGRDRDIGDWIREKQLLLNWPWYLQQPDLNVPQLTQLSPAYFEDGTDKVLARLDHLVTIADNKFLEKLCATGTSLYTEPSLAPEETLIRVPNAYFLIGWYFIEHRMPGEARRCWLLGARECEKLAKATEDAIPKNSRLSLFFTLNKIRLLLAAASIRQSPEGALSSDATYLTELQVLLAAWRTRWLSAGFANRDCTDILADTTKAISLVQEFLLIKPKAPERYFFIDYRFAEGDVPDSFITAVSAEAPSLETDAIFALLKNLSSVPAVFDRSIIERWTAPLGAPTAGKTRQSESY